MGFDLEKRVANELNRLEDDAAHNADLKPQKRVEHFKRLAEELKQRLLGGEAADEVAGKRTQIDKIYATTITRLNDIAMNAQAALGAIPWQQRPGFDDYRARGLREVIGALGSHRKKLQQATFASADPVVRNRLANNASSAKAKPDAGGQTMWRVAERRAATLYRHAMDGGEVASEDPVVDEALAKVGSGQALPQAVRKKMEAELGISLSRVRVHTDAVAAAAARTVRADAFTVGEDIFFAEHTYAPETRDGQKLLAHELTHVVQAYQGRTSTGGSGISVSQPGESLEREADAVAERVISPERSLDQRPTLERAKPRSPQARATASQPVMGMTRASGATPAIQPAPQAPSRMLLRREAPKAPDNAAPRPPSDKQDPNKKGTKPKLRLVRDHDKERAMRLAKRATDLRAQGLNHGDAIKDATKHLKQVDKTPVGKKAKALGDTHHAKAKHHAKDAKDVQKLANTKKHDAGKTKKHAQHGEKHDNTGAGPVHFKEISNWQKYMPEELPDTDPREKKRILELVKKQINSDRKESAQSLNSLRLAQLKQAKSVRAMAPGLQGTIRAAQGQAIGTVSASEASQAAAVQSHVAGVQAAVRQTAASVKGQIASAHSTAVAAVKAAQKAATQTLTDSKTAALGDIDAAEATQIVAVGALFLAVRADIAAVGAEKAGEAMGVPATVSWSYDGEKLEAAQKAAQETAAGYAEAMPGEATKAADQVCANQPKCEEDVRKMATDQRKAVEDAFTEAKKVVDQATEQAITAANTIKSESLSQVDSTSSTTCSQLAAHGAAQVSAIRGQGAAARAGITTAGNAASAGVAKAVAQAATGIEKGAKGLIAGAKHIEAPNVQDTHKAVAQGVRDLGEGTRSLGAGFKKTAATSVASLKQQASGAAQGMAATAASAKQTASQMGAGAQQGMTAIGKGSADSLKQLTQNHKKSVDDIAKAGDTGMKDLVKQLKDAYKTASKDLGTSLDNTVNDVRTSFGDAVPTQEAKDIKTNGDKAADAVKPWWQKALAFVVSIVVAILVVVVITAIVGATGGAALILVGAAAGALGSVLGTMASNLVLGNGLMDGITWQSVAMGAIGGAVGAGFSQAATAGARVLGASGSRFASAGTRVFTALTETSAGGFGNIAIRTGVGMANDIASDAVSSLIVTGQYQLTMENLATSLVTNALSSTPKYDALQTRFQDGIRTRVPGIEIHSGGTLGVTNWSVTKGSGPGGHVGPGGFQPTGVTPHDGGTAPTQHADATPTPRPAGGTQADGTTTPRPAGGTQADGTTTPRPAGGTQADGTTTPRPAGGTQADGTTTPRPADGAQADGTTTPRPAGGTQADGTTTPRPAGGTQADGTTTPHPAGDPTSTHTGDQQTRTGDQQTRTGDQQTRTGDGDATQTNRTGDDAPRRTQDGGDGVHDQGGAHDPDGAHPDADGAHTGGDTTPDGPESASADMLDGLGYPNATRAKADEAAAAIDSGGKPKPDTVRDTEANAHGLKDLEHVDADPKLTPESKANVRGDVAEHLRGDEPSGNLHRDVAEAKAREEARIKAEQEAGTGPKDPDGTAADGEQPPKLGGKTNEAEVKRLDTEIEAAQKRLAASDSPEDAVTLRQLLTERAEASGQKTVESIDNTKIRDIAKEAENFWTRAKELEGELFGPEGPKPSDLQQGALGDCYLLATLQALAHRDPQIIRDMVRANPDGTYTVTFRSAAKVEFRPDGTRVDIPGGIKEITVTGTVPKGRFGGGEKYGSSKEGTWPQLIEKAYAQEYGGATGYEGIGHGGYPSEVMQNIYGAAHAHYESVGRPGDLNFEGIKARFEAGTVLVVSSRSAKWYELGRKMGLPGSSVPNHAWAVVGVRVDATGRQFIELYNPHNTSGKYGSRFEMPYQQFLKDFDGIYSSSYDPVVGQQATPSVKGPSSLGSGTGLKPSVKPGEGAEGADGKTATGDRTPTTPKSDPATLKSVLEKSGKTIESLKGDQWGMKQTVTELLKAKGVDQPTKSQIDETTHQLDEAIKSGNAEEFKAPFEGGVLKTEDNVNERLGNVFNEKKVYDPSQLSADNLKLNQYELQRMQGGYESGEAGMLMAASFINTQHRSEGDFSHAYGEKAWDGFVKAETYLRDIPKGKFLETLNVDTMIEVNRLIHAPDTGMKAMVLRTLAMIGRGGHWDVAGEIRTGRQFARPEKYSAAEMANLTEAGVHVKKTGKQTEEGGKAMLEYPSPDKVKPTLEHLVNKLKEDMAKPDADPIAAAAEFQRKFVALHPFGDSNGRTSRALMNRILVEYDLPPAILADQNRDISLSPKEWRDEVAKGVARSKDFLRSNQYKSKDNYLGDMGIRAVASSPDKPITIDGRPFDLGTDGLLYDPNGRPHIVEGGDIIPLSQMEHFVISRRIFQSGKDAGTALLMKTTEETRALFDKVTADPSAGKGIKIRSDAGARKADTKYQLAPEPEVAALLARLTDISGIDPAKLFSIDYANGTAISSTMSKHAQMDLEFWYVQKGLKDSGQKDLVQQVKDHRAKLFEMARAEILKHQDPSRISAENPMGFHYKYEKMMYDSSPLRHESFEQAIHEMGDNTMTVWRGDYSFARLIGMAPNNDIRQPDAKRIAEQRGEKSQLMNMYDELVKLEGTAVGRQYICTTSDLALLAGQFASGSNQQTVNLGSLPGPIKRHLMDWIEPNTQGMTPEQIAQLRVTAEARGDSVLPGQQGGKEIKDAFGIPGTILTLKVVDKDGAKVQVMAPRKAFQIVINKDALLPGVYALGGPSFMAEQELHGLERVSPWKIKQTHEAQKLKEEFPVVTGGAAPQGPTSTNP